MVVERNITMIIIRSGGNSNDHSPKKLRCIISSMIAEDNKNADMKQKSGKQEYNEVREIFVSFTSTPDNTSSVSTTVVTSSDNTSGSMMVNL